MAEETIGRAAEELGRFRDAKARAEAELAEVRGALDAETTEERRLFEESARSSRPAKPRKRVRELKEREENLVRQLGTLALLLPRLEAAAPEEELEGVSVEQRALEVEFEAALEGLRLAEAVRDDVQGRVYSAVEEAREIGARLREARDRLAAVDPDERVRRLQEAEQRREVAEQTFEAHAEVYRREMLAEAGLRPAERG